MTRIICDTMIWYGLSKNELQRPDPEKYTLVCTYLSLAELAFTPNVFKDLGQVQDVVRTIFSLEPEFIMQWPLDYAKKIIDAENVPNYVIEEDLILGFLRVLLNSPKEGLADNKYTRQLIDVSSKRKDNSSDWADFINTINKPFKETKGVLKRHYDNSDMRFFRDRFVFQLNEFSKKIYSTESIDWNRFEFYENVEERYRRNLLLSGMKADRNDANDLQNMIYVQPGDKYWTLEKRWLTIIKEIGLDKYLYSHPNTQ